MAICFLFPRRLTVCLLLPPAAVEEVKLKHTHYTLEHVRAFGMYNYLHLDPWYEESVLFVDCKGRVLCLTVTLVRSQCILTFLLNKLFSFFFRIFPFFPFIYICQQKDVTGTF